MNTYHIKLINGEELITKVNKKTLESDELELIHPMVVEVLNDEEGSRTVLSNYLKFVLNPKCFISKSKIITYVPVPLEVETYYKNSKPFADQHDLLFLREIVKANKLVQEYHEGLHEPINEEEFIMDLPAPSKTVH